MVRGDSGDSPFEAIAETVNNQTVDALELLGNETRLEIIVALWDAIERTPIGEESESGLSFSELYDRVGVQDSGQFNYHLNKLTGTFVTHDDDTYSLTGAAFDILAAVMRGAVTDPPSFTDEPVDGDCPLCGESVVIDYEEGLLSIRCTNCEGNFRRPEDPHGLLMTSNRSPMGLRNRTPQEFFLQGNVSHRNTVASFMNGVCPECTGTVTVTPDICETHEPGDDSVCPQCNRYDEIWWHFDCDMCKKRAGAEGRSPIWLETEVLSFCYERGLDVNAAVVSFEWSEMYGITDETVSSRDPLEVTVTVELEGDRLTVTLDEDANVVNVEKTIGVA